MTYSLTETESTTFTIVHARHMAAKIAADLKRLQRFYGYPGDTMISSYEAEITELLRGGYLKEVTYGFRRDEKWIEPTLRYKARDLAGTSANDDDPGRIRPGVDIRGTSFYSYLIHNAAWDSLPAVDRAAIEERLPIKRNGAPEPAINGYLSDDRTYSAGGRALNRASVRSY
ncbi:MAG: hypothetical protein AAB299_10045 [Thermodesulfobacteriota bacterium]|mgnify:CR=1 FL=1